MAKRQVMENGNEAKKRGDDFDKITIDPTGDFFCTLIFFAEFVVCLGYFLSRSSSEEFRSGQFGESGIFLSSLIAVSIAVFGKFTCLINPYVLSVIVFFSSLLSRAFRRNAHDLVSLVSHLSHDSDSICLRLCGAPHFSNFT